MRVDCVGDSRGASIMEEMRAIRDAPKRSRAKLATRCRLLREAIGQARSHVVDQQIGVGADELSRTRERGCVALSTPDRVEQCCTRRIEAHGQYLLNRRRGALRGAARDRGLFGGIRRAMYTSVEGLSTEILLCSTLRARSEMSRRSVEEHAAFGGVL